MFVQVSHYLPIIERVPFKSVYVVLKLCKNENTRKVHNTAYESRNQENIALLEEVSNKCDETIKIDQ